MGFSPTPETFPDSVGGPEEANCSRDVTHNLLLLSCEGRVRQHSLLHIFHSSPAALLIWFFNIIQQTRNKFVHFFFSTKKVWTLANHQVTYYLFVYTLCASRRRDYFLIAGYIIP